MEEPTCQIHSWPSLSEGAAPLPPQGLAGHLKLMLKRLLRPQTKRKLKRYINPLMSVLNRRSGKTQPNVAPAQEVPAPAQATLELRPGDLVRIRSREEIEATLDGWDELKGCAVMADMWKYCGTVQRVLKPVTRFVDERDYKVKKARGLVLLEGLICEGTPQYGRCDRACFFFWRVEWLEKLEDQQIEESESRA